MSLFVISNLAFAACAFAPSEPLSGTAMTVDSSGRLVMLAHLCPDAEIIAMRVTSQPTEKALWQVSGKRGLDATDFPVGITPAGFSTKVPLRNELTAGHSYGVSIITKEPQAPGELIFDPSELTRKTVLADRGTMSRSEFMASDCRE